MRIRFRAWHWFAVVPIVALPFVLNRIEPTKHGLAAMVMAAHAVLLLIITIRVGIDDDRELKRRRAQRISQGAKNSP